MEEWLPRRRILKGDVEILTLRDRIDIFKQQDIDICMIKKLQGSWTYNFEIDWKNIGIR